MTRRKKFLVVAFILACIVVLAVGLSQGISNRGPSIYTACRPTNGILSYEDQLAFNRCVESEQYRREHDQ